ncbi:MAG TPA: heme o synthase [Flavobacteriales bacterium]
MEVNRTTAIESKPLNSSIIKDIATLFKLRLSLLVIISAILGYFVGTRTVDWSVLIALSLGGFLLTGGSNGMNQVWERNWDKLMMRTQNRPIPSGSLTPLKAGIISMAAGIIGIALLWIYVNTATGVLGLLAFFLYVFVYTPLKRITSLAVFVGAFPGAVPPMLGYIAATGTYGIEAGSLFAMQFMWQFPHFWAIAWVAHDDYQRGGYNLLPFKEGRSKRSAYQIFLYSLFLIPVSLLPWAFPAEKPLVGNIAAAVAIIAGGTMTWYAYKLYRSCDIKDAKKVMFASFFYLPLVQIFYVIDKL